MRKLLLLAAILLLAAAPGALLGWALWGLPDPDELLAAAPPPSTLILDRNGNLLYEIVAPDSARSEPVSLADVPRYLRLATLATEDAEFYSHPGLDLRAIARAIYYDVRYQRIVSGGSTITQQVARNLLLKSEREERTLRRKLREAVLAVLIEARYSKDDILALYLNSTFYGRQAYGVAAAAKAYFGKSVSVLDLAECAFLAGLPQAPSLYDPAVGDSWRERQRVVLGLLARQGFITEEEAQAAAREQLTIVAPGHDIRAPHFVMYVREQLLQLFSEEAIYNRGLRVYTTLDLPVQERAQEILGQSLEKVNDRLRTQRQARVENGAVLALDAASGAILAMVGSPDYFDESISGAVNAVLALRQPGSAIKPLTYAAAFERGYTPATMVADVPTSFVTDDGQSYVPLNYDLSYHGPVLLREALASSYNVVAVKVLDHIGLPALLEMARRLGITTLDSVEALGLSATLGGGEVSLLELTTAYAAFANAGMAVTPYAIDYVTDSQGKLLWQHEQRQMRRVLSPQVAYLITDILSDDKARIPTFGEGSVLSLPWPAAVKTGTTTDCRDNWTVGYTSQVVVGVWVGNADGSSMGRVSGVMGAAPVWHEVMVLLHRQLPSVPFLEPAGMVHIEVCADSGLLPGPYCSRRRRELFIAGTEPTRTCDMHRLYNVDARTGYLADRDTPPEFVLPQVFTVLPLEALAWGDEHDLPRPPQPRPGSQENLPAAAEMITMRQPQNRGSYTLVADLPARWQCLGVEAAVSSDISVSLVRLLVDDTVLAELRQPPYRIMWQLEPGEHAFSAEVVSTDGRHWRSEAVSITVRR
ncbi:MAG: penicillin-binding protein 1C [Anaerolineae bacterium]